jgi:hypothetical protein
VKYYGWDSSKILVTQPIVPTRQITQQVNEIPLEGYSRGLLPWVPQKLDSNIMNTEDRYELGNRQCALMNKIARGRTFRVTQTNLLIYLGNIFWTYPIQPKLTKAQEARN